MLVAHFNRKNKRKLKFRKLFASVSSYILLDQLKKNLNKILAAVTATPQPPSQHTCGANFKIPRYSQTRPVG